MAVVPAAFVALAAFAAAAARRRPLSPTLVDALAVPPTAMVAAAGIVTTTTGIDQGGTLLVGAVGAGTLAVGVAALALAGRRPGRGAPALIACWFLALGLAALLLAPAALYAAIVPGILLRTVGGADNPHSVLMSFQPGVLLVVVPIAAAPRAATDPRRPLRRQAGPGPGAHRPLGTVERHGVLRRTPGRGARWRVRLRVRKPPFGGSFSAVRQLLPSERW